MKWLAKLILVGLLSSCSAQWHLKRAIKKDPTIVRQDTAVVVDTVVTPPVTLTDTITLAQRDTITLVKDRLKVKIIRSSDTIRVDAVCESDTIISVVEVPYDKIIYVEQKTLLQKIQELAFYIGLGLLALIIIKRLTVKYLFND
jgi:hypothetical protein